MYLLSTVEKYTQNSHKYIIVYVSISPFNAVKKYFDIQMFKLLLGTDLGLW